MPELPEVETFRRFLSDGRPDSPSLVGLVLQGGAVLWERTLAEPAAAEFSMRLAGQTVQAIERRGKYLILRLDRDTLIIHLRMSGDLLVETGVPEPGAYHRLTLQFDNGCRLAFSDPRKFGRVWLLADPAPLLSRLGPEPFDEDLSAEEFYRRLHARARQLKPLLLDQAFLAGLGNIYTDEALNLAGLHPLALSNTLSEGDAMRLLAAIRQVLTEGIHQNGASIDWVYRGGGFQNSFRVYQRTGQPCPACGTLVERIVVGQRGTHFCPNCQRLR